MERPKPRGLPDCLNPDIPGFDHSFLCELGSVLHDIYMELDEKGEDELKELRPQMRRLQELVRQDMKQTQALISLAMGLKRRLLNEISACYETELKRRNKTGEHREVDKNYD